MIVTLTGFLCLSVKRTGMTESRHWSESISVNFGARRFPIVEILLRWFVQKRRVIMAAPLLPCYRSSFRRRETASSLVLTDDERRFGNEAAAAAVAVAFAEEDVCRLLTAAAVSGGGRSDVITTGRRRRQQFALFSVAPLHATVLKPNFHLRMRTDAAEL